MIEEIAVYDVNQAVQLLFYQATHRDFKDELCKQLAMETQRGQYKLKNKTKTVQLIKLVYLFSLAWLVAVKRHVMLH